MKSFDVFKNENTRVIHQYVNFTELFDCLMFLFQLIFIHQKTQWCKKYLVQGSDEFTI